LVENRPAAIQGSLEKISAKSGALIFLIPQWIPEARKPGTAVMPLGIWLIEVFMVVEFTATPRGM
jgi:hypothetical protein